MAVLERKRTFLEREEWLTVPWQKWPQTIAQERELWELRVVLPGIWQDVEDWERAGPLNDFARTEIVSRLRVNLTRLLRWRFHWEDDNGSRTSERPASAVVNVISDIPRPECLGSCIWYDDAFRAVEIIHFHGLLAMFLYLGVRLFEPFLLRKVLVEDLAANERCQTKGALLVPEDSWTVTEYTTQMARSIDYLISTVGFTVESLPIASTLRIW